MPTLDSGVKMVYRVEVKGEYKLVAVSVRGFKLANNLKKDQLVGDEIEKAIKAQYGKTAKVTYQGVVDTVEVF